VCHHRQGLTTRRVHKGWATTHNIPTTWATTQGSLGYQPSTISQPLGLQPKGRWAPTQYNIPTTWATTQGSLGTNPVQLISPSISVILNSVHRGVSSQVNPTQSIEEYDLENVSRSCNHQHSLSARGAFSTTPSLSRKYSNFDLARGLVRTSAICSSVGRYCTSTAFLCTMSRM
jgi:hypothetical protein